MPHSEHETRKRYATLSNKQRFIIDTLTPEQRSEYLQFTETERELYDTLMKEGRTVRETIQLIKFIKGDESTLFTANTGLQFMSPENAQPKTSAIDNLFEEFRQLKLEKYRLEREVKAKNIGLKAQGLVIQQLSRQNVEHGERIKELEAQLARLQHQ